MFAQSTPISDERAVETGQLSQGAQPRLPKVDTVGYFEPHQMAKLAEHGRLYVIADSAGDAASGQMAAQYAVKKILRVFYTSATPDLEARLREAIQQANQDIVERNKQHPARRPLAAYVTAALIHNNKLLVANAGDNRVYVVWDKDIEQLNTSTSQAEDDKPAQEPVPSPRLLPEQATTPSDQAAKSLDLSAASWPTSGPLGLEEKVRIETFSRRLFAGDTLVLSSGGLSGYVSEQEIAEAMTLHAPDQAIQQLMSLATERGNSGHIAISVTRILSSPVAARSPMPMVMPTPPQWSDWEIPAKPATRPLSKPIPASSPVGELSGPRPLPGPQRKSKPIAISLSQPRGLPWRGCSLTAVILVMLCVLPILAWRFLLPADTLASVPFLAEMAETIKASAETFGLDFPETAESEPAISSPGASVAEGGTLPTPTVLVEPAATTATANTSPLPTPTATSPPEASSPTVAATPTTEIIPTATPTPPLLPTIELPVNCESKARFVTDVTVEDGSQFPPGRQFDKVWRVRNEGSCPWGPGFTARFLNGDFFGAQQEIPLVEVTTPDETGDISAPMIAPTEPGDYRGVWQLYDPAGEPFGPTMSVEIEVAPGAVAEVETTGSNTLYDFIAQAGSATWSSGPVDYTVQQTPVSEDLTLPDSGGLVAVGVAQLRGNTQSQGPVLLTYPNQGLGFIQGNYVVDTPLQPDDALVATLGFTKLSILSDDGVTFEVSFTPDDGSQVISILSQNVQYAESPITETIPLTGIEPGQTGLFTLRVLSGPSPSRDWALWIDLRLVRP